MNDWATYTAAIASYPWEHAVRMLATNPGARETQLLLTRYRDLRNCAIAHHPHGEALLRRYDVLAFHLPQGWEHLVSTANQPPIGVKG